MTITRTTVEEFVLEEVWELDRITKCFTGARRKRLLAIWKSFKDRNFENMICLYNELPYDEYNKCSEKEYVGSWFKVFSDHCFEFPPVSSKVSVTFNSYI